MTSPNPLPAILTAYPSLDAWIRIDPEETVTVFTGKVEIGQGIRTTIAQIAAEELDLSLDRIRVVLADTARTPDEGYTAGSNSTQGSGAAVRVAAAEARHVLLRTAAVHLDAPAERLRILDGLIVDPVSERQISYWQLQGGRPFQQAITGQVPVKSYRAYRLVGTSAPRLDLPDKVQGVPTYVADMRLPGTVFGQVVRARWPGATLLYADTSPIERLPGVLSLVRDGNFLGLVAETEWQAMQAADVLRTMAQWSPPEPFPPEDAIFERLETGPTQPFLVIDGVPTGQPIPPIQAPQDAGQTLAATYYRPFQMHAALGPSAAVAQWQEDRLTVWTHSQGVFPLRGALAQVLGITQEAVRVIHVEGPGCYGHNGADDVALDAALLSRSVPGRPVLVQWSRTDEFLREPYGPAMVVQIQASLDAAGSIVDWNHDVRSFTHSGRPRPQTDSSGLMAAWELAEPLPQPVPRPGGGYHGGIHRNADPLYNFPRRRVVKHFVPGSPVRTSSMRSLGAIANIFAIESFMDELAAVAEVDPVLFRLAHLDDPRARAVIEAAAQASGWQTAARKSSSGDGYGQGIAFAQYKNEKCYAAVVADVQVDRSSGQICLEKVTVAADAGQIINPDGLRNQLEGGVVQAASWALKEAVRLGPRGVESADWGSYPILRMEEAPDVHVLLLDQPGQAPLGAGEAVQGPTPAAIANAVYQASGVRLRRMPFTRERFLAG